MPQPAALVQRPARDPEQHVAGREEDQAQCAPSMVNAVYSERGNWAGSHAQLWDQARTAFGARTASTTTASATCTSSGRATRSQYERAIRLQLTDGARPDLARRGPSHRAVLQLRTSGTMPSSSATAECEKTWVPESSRRADLGHATKRSGNSAATSTSDHHVRRSRARDRRDEGGSASLARTSRG